MTDTPFDLSALVDSTPGLTPEARERLAARLQTLIESEQVGHVESRRRWQRASWTHRAVVIAVAAAIVVVFFVPLPHVSLFHNLVAPAKVTPTNTPNTVAARVTPTSVTGADGYLWMLGTYPCETSTCPVLMRSTDGGKSWARVGTPPPSVDTLVFANGEDGYAYFQGSATEKSVLYWTGDSGKSWRLAPAAFQESQVLSVVTTEGHAYVLADEHCVVNRGCKTLDLGSSAVTDDTWTIRGVPIDTVQYNVDLAAFGSKVWLFVVSGGGSNAKVLVSDDGGASFTNLPSTGMEGLSCRATATSATTLWAFCATGLEGGGLRSTDGGRVFERLSGWKGASPNGADILPVSDSEAVYLWGGGPYMYLTRDGGRKFSSLWRRQNLNYGYSIAFADKKAWVILGVNEGPSGNNLMWRTTNGGHTWQSVKAPTVKATTSTATPSGVVTGQTADCTAFSPPVKVSLYSGTTFVASVTVPAGTSYRFVVAPGSYWLTGLDGAGASGVTVRAGRTVTVNSPLLDCQ